MNMSQELSFLTHLSLIKIHQKEKYIAYLTDKQGLNERYFLKREIYCLFL